MPSPPARPLVIGHRGCRGLAPENTLPGIEQALDLGVDAVEIDLHLTRDGQVLVSHDPGPRPGLCRTQNDLRPEQALLWAALDLAEIQSSYIADLNPDPKRFPDQQNRFTGRLAPQVMAGAASPFSPPSLVQVFELLGRYARTSPACAEHLRRFRVYLEIKRVPFYEKTWLGPYESRFEEQIVKIVRSLDNQLFGITVLSFDPTALKAIRRLDFTMEIALLNSDPPADLPAVISALHPQVWCPHFSILRHIVIPEVQALGLRVIPWTVNTLEEMQVLVDWQVDGLITDFPKALLGILG